ncbi:hypothetical protein [Simkania negevensis]|uniref:Uncharacterized protein n=1 Tax=Simkania negevensis (strain ATCC VR-1471 / DSM 27360 / Z) TaxID=331113 RepID=F8L7F7_SIMNZ|nr:hypothetical protein [Simkania negevensis]CCB88690.1 unknown protein [Simkania negevensis Z]
MATIDFSLPMWGTCQARTTYESYEYLKETIKHSDEAKTEDFSRVKTTAFLLLSVAMTFFHGLALEAKALGEGGLYYLSNEAESARKSFTENGKEGLKTLGFSLYQLFLACVALLNPSEVKSRLALPEPVQLKPGLLSDDPEDITNVLMFQNTALRKQITLLQGQLGVTDPEGLVAKLLEANQNSEENFQRAALRAEQDIGYQEGLVKDLKKQLQDKDQIMQHQKEQDEERIRDLQKKLEQSEHTWKYFQHALGEGKELSTRSPAQILERLKNVWARPHLIRGYKFD